MAKDEEGMNVLHHVICVWGRHEKVQTIALLIRRGVQLQTGEEFGIGGLFDSDLDTLILSKIYDLWDNYIIPALQHNMNESTEDCPPILQAAVIYKAPREVINSTIQHLDCITITDSMGRYPIDVAIEHGLKWDGGMREIAEAFAAAEERSIFFICARHGLQWDNGMSTICDTSSMDDFETSKDIAMGLYPFAIAAMGHRYDLGTIFNLVKKSPNIVKLYSIED